MERVYYERDENNQKTGITVAVITEGEERFIGISRCSQRDNFIKRIGRAAAMGRAKHLQDLKQGNKQRQLSENYFGLHLEAPSAKSVELDIKTLDGVQTVTVPDFLICAAEHTGAI